MVEPPVGGRRRTRALTDVAHEVERRRVLEVRVCRAVEPGVAGAEGRIAGRAPRAADLIVPATGDAGDEKKVEIHAYVRRRARSAVANSVHFADDLVHGIGRSRLRVLFEGASPVSLVTVRSLSKPPRSLSMPV